MIASTKTLSVHPNYSMCFPLTYLPGRGVDMATSCVRHGNTVPIGSSRRAPLSLTKTMQTCSELTPAVAEHYSSQASCDAVTPAKCAPLELLLSNCSMWPQRRAVAFSLSVWLRLESDVELSADSLSSLSTTDVSLSPAGALQLSTCS